MLIDIKETKNIIVELDADSLVYRIGGAVDMLGEGKHFAERTIEQAVDSIYEETGARQVNIYLGTSSNYRNDIAKILKYKGNRDRNQRPQFYTAIRAYLVTKCGARLVKDQEAEDAVGIAAYTYKDFDRFIVGAIDKDLDMIAGWHYNYATKQMKFIDKYQALRAFYVQLVTGDMTDNIPAIFQILKISGRVEEANAFKGSRYKKKLIEALGEMNTELEMWDHVENLYKEHLNLTIDVSSAILEIARLLWIRRYLGELWVPPTQRDWNYIDNDTREVK